MTQVLCRIDHEGKPVVFIADSLKNGQIKAWREGEQEIRRVGIDYYQASQPLSEKDAAHLAKKYGKAFNEETVFVRQRLPRNYRVIPDVLTGNGKNGKSGKTSGRKAAAQKRYQEELSKTSESGNPPAVVVMENTTGAPQPSGAVEQAAKTSGLDMNDPNTAQLIINIAKILQGKI